MPQAHGGGAGISDGSYSAQGLLERIDLSGYLREDRRLFARHHKRDDFLEVAGSRKAREEARRDQGVSGNARITGVDTVRVFAGVPFIDLGVVLHAGIAADPCTLPNHLHQLARLIAWSGTAAQDMSRRPVGVLLDRMHEFVGDA